MRVQAASTISEAPFQKMRVPPAPASRQATPMVFLALLKGCMCSTGMEARRRGKEAPGREAAKRSSACSVGEPATSGGEPGGAPSRGGDTAPVVFRKQDWMNRSSAAGGTSSALAARSGGLSTPAVRLRTTVIWLVVSVPVLSEQIVVAPPMPSQAERWRTSALSTESICPILKARLSVTASGRPSGTATTMMVTATMKAEMSAVYQSLGCATVSRTSRMMKTTTATSVPTLPMEVATASRRIWRGVSSSFSSLVTAMMRPHSVFIPVAVTSISPQPSLTLQPESMKGLDSGSFLTGSDSPVIALSSITTPWPESSRPSAGTWSPVAMTTMSPTTSSKTDTVVRRPARSTLIMMLRRSAERARNWRACE